MLILKQNHIKKAINMSQAIDVVEKAFIAYSSGKTRVPIRTQLEVSQEEGVALYMPGYVKELKALGVKIVTVFPNNYQKELPTINALIVLNDASTGVPIAVMEGSYLTALRTGAASGVATRHLAREDSTVVAIIGSGVQARTQLEGVCNVRPIKEVRVFDIDSTKAEQYVEEMEQKLKDFDIKYCVAATPEEAVEKADIICTATTSKKPVFAGEAIKPGVHINAVGAFTPRMQEIGEDVIGKADKICVDSVEAALEEAGDLIIPMNKGLLKKEEIYAEIGEIASGQKRGREGSEEITLFKTVGLSVQDMAVAMLTYRRSKEMGLGEEFEL